MVTLLVEIQSKMRTETGRRATEFTFWQCNFRSSGGRQCEMRGRNWWCRMFEAVRDVLHTLSMGCKLERGPSADTWVALCMLRLWEVVIRIQEVLNVCITADGDNRTGDCQCPVWWRHPTRELYHCQWYLPLGILSPVCVPVFLFIPLYLLFWEDSGVGLSRESWNWRWITYLILQKWHSFNPLLCITVMHVVPCLYDARG